MANKVLLIIILTIFSGTLLGLSFPPYNFWYLSFFSLLPLYESIRRLESYLSIGLAGFITGIFFIAIVTWPLTSASTWTGWAELTLEESTTFQDNYLNGLLLIWSVLTLIGGGISFALFSIIFKWLFKKLPLTTLLFGAPVFWMLIVEYARTLLFYDYQWMPIGSILINLPWLSQLASFGGIWLLGGIVVSINGFIYLLLLNKRIATTISKPLIASVIVYIAFIVLGVLRYESISKHSQNQQNIKVAIIQLSLFSYTIEDFTPFFMDKHYFHLLKNAYKQHSDKFDILVLPESIGFGGVSLDGTVSEKNPDKTLSKIQDWHDNIKSLITKPSLLVFGIDTVENKSDYNSIIVWNEKGPFWRYNKKRLVPYAEYIPDNLRTLGLKGKSTYKHGAGSSTMKLKKLKIGFFICQEVLFPDLVAEIVRDGAELLITVGNDGVFSNPAVAKANSIEAQLRAIESGRYVVRAMKSGISSIITPSGEIRNSIGVNQKGLIISQISPLKQNTIYSKFYQWFPWIFLILGSILIFIRFIMRNTFSNHA